MTRQEQLDLIRDACIEANPDKEWIRCAVGDCTVHISKIGLADVLFAIGKKERGHLFARADGKTVVFFVWNKFGDANCHAVEPTYKEWNLCNDDLTDQSDECVAFVAELLQSHN